jgi:hypothetical protein
VTRAGVKGRLCPSPLLWGGRGEQGTAVLEQGQCVELEQLQVDTTALLPAGAGG